jgi:hypothetical protein
MIDVSDSKRYRLGHARLPFCPSCDAPLNLVHYWKTGEGFYQCYNHHCSVETVSMWPSRFFALEPGDKKIIVLTPEPFWASRYIGRAEQRLFAFPEFHMNPFKNRWILIPNGIFNHICMQIIAGELIAHDALVINRTNKKNYYSFEKATEDIIEAIEEKYGNSDSPIIKFRRVRDSNGS